MDLVCRSLPNVSIGNNYGGYLQNLSISVGFNSSSSFEATFLKPDTDFSEPKLSSEDAIKLKIGETSFDVYALSFTIKKSSSGRFMTVKFGDSSIKYLDKYNIGFLGENINERVLQLLPLDLSGEQRNLGLKIGSYKMDDLEKLLPCKRTIRVKNAFNKWKDLRTGEFGTIRDVLSSFGSKIGVVFFWNFTENSLDAVDLSNADQETSGLANTILTTYNSLISDYTKSSSIEDGNSVSQIAWQIRNNEISPTTSTYLNTYAMEIWKGDWRLVIGAQSDWIDNNNDSEITFDEVTNHVYYKFTEAQKKSGDFLRLAAAALGTPEFFKQYVYYSMACSSLSNNSMSIKWKANNLGGFYTDSLITTYTNGIGTPNNLLKTLFDQIGFDFQLLYESDGDLGDDVIPYVRLIKELQNANAPGRADIAATLSGSGRNNHKFWYTNHWMFAIKNSVKNSKIGVISIDEFIHTMYTMFRLYGQYYGRFYIGSDQMSSKQYKSWNLETNGVSFLPDRQDVNTTELSELAKLLLKWKGYLGFDGVAWYSFSQNFLRNTLALSRDNQETLDNSTSDGFQTSIGVKGRLLFDLGERKDSVFYSNVPYFYDDIRYLGGNEAVNNSLNNYSLKGICVKSDILYEVERNKNLIEVLDDRSFFASKINEPYSFDNFQWGHSLTDQKAHTVVANTIEMEEIGSEEIFSEYMDNIDKRIYHARNPANSYSFTIEDAITIAPNWLSNGMESYSMKLSSEGVTTDITIGTRRKLRMSKEAEDRLVSKKSIVGASSIKVPKSSTNRFSTGFIIARDK